MLNVKSVKSMNFISNLKIILRNFIINFMIIICQIVFVPIVMASFHIESKQLSGLTKVGLTDVPTKERLDLEYFIKERAYEKLLEQDILPYINQKNLKSTTCFISYAWGDAYHEFWVKRLAEMLTKAGFTVFLDRWEDRKGKVLNNFVKKIDEADWIIVVGTKLYLEKYNRRAASLKDREHVVRVEAQLIEYLISYSTERGDKVVPVLLEGTVEESLPFMMRHKIPSEFTKNDYFEELLRLVHDLYRIDNQDKAFENFVDNFRKYSLVIGANITKKDREEFAEKQKKEIAELDKKIISDVDRFRKEALK